jgi:hypothetical protein
MLKLNYMKRLFKNKYFYFLCAAVVIILASLAILEKTHVINLYHKSNINTQSDQPKPPNTVDYSAPAYDVNNDPTINSAKKSDNSSSSTPSSASVTITRASQNPDRSIIISALVIGIASGTCNLQLIQNNSVGYSTEAPIVQQNTLFTCNGFWIDINNIPNSGDWSVKVTATGDSGSASAAQNINISK